MSDVYWARSGHEHPVPKGFVGYTDKVSFPYVGDVGRAKQLLAEAGYRDEVSVPVTGNDKAHSGESWRSSPASSPASPSSGDPNDARLDPSEDGGRLPHTPAAPGGGQR